MRNIIRIILAFIIVTMSTPIAANQLSARALYRAELPQNAHQKMVATVEITLDENAGHLFWHRIICTKLNKETFTIWFLADNNLFAAKSEKPVTFLRYILQEYGQPPIEYIEQRSGQLLLPLFNFREKLLPRSISDTNEPLFEKGTSVNWISFTEN